MTCYGHDSAFQCVKCQPSHITGEIIKNNNLKYIRLENADNFEIAIHAITDKSECALQ